MSELKREMLKKTIVLIPSLDPDEMLGSYVQGLQKEGFDKIVIVDDGSREENRKNFPKAAGNEVVILKHAVNQGKGRALKTGFHYILNTYESSEIVGVITADADGQHSVEDTVKVALKLAEEECLVLGTRNFNEEQVPFKSRNGNKITTIVFQMLFGKKINDTQTGLRGIPYEFLKKCLTLRGERFEYEINMLIEAVRSKIKITEVFIRTIYFNSNRATHFSAVKDSAKIYGVMFYDFFRFSCSGLMSFVIDIGAFAFFTKLIFPSQNVAAATFLGTVLARAISSLFNFFVNKNIFACKGFSGKCMLRYYILCLGQLIVSWLLVIAVFQKLHWDTTIIKTLIDMCLFFVSYHIQRRWVFREEKE